MARGSELGPAGPDRWYADWSSREPDTERVRERRGRHREHGPRHGERRAPTQREPGPDTEGAERAPEPDTVSAGGRHGERD